ncbi:MULTISPECIES: PapB/FocB family fimbrial expression transcriptional regulator [Pseudomonas]|uniref:PapB/FocB family fimbrial expression transcriptional regulator n=1 Tax=Pseudomonas TaxID=286 RepID=UPI001475553F|nr:MULTISPECIES: PapB/FocB family fimbrial expression transcriptional regulator [Pseudomonas]MEC4242089.1 PapB/FocB family fimbrial expression transcriptional regulator [Pseudomonas sp. DSV-1]NNB34009.1 Na(+)-translocating NADH-quinone reductase subunit C [Pseudomonas fragi]
MQFAVGKLVPGRVDPEQFDLLLAGTSIRSKELILALRDHLVGGRPVSEVVDENLVNLNQFYKRLRVLQAEHERAARLSRFYVQLAPQ